MKCPDKTTIPRIKKVIVLFMALSLLCIQTNKSTLAQEVEEYAVKAAFTFNFIRFTQWPETSFSDDIAPYKLCFMGNSEVARHFKAITGKKNGARSINVQGLSLVEEYGECKIVFISRDVDRSITQGILSKVKGKPVLTIGETRDFIKLGGVMNFISKDGRLHFEVNTQAAKQQGIELSSRLLKLAIIVDE
jgi:hypothetical protein